MLNYGYNPNGTPPGSNISNLIFNDDAPTFIGEISGAGPFGGAAPGIAGAGVAGGCVCVGWDGPLNAHAPASTAAAKSKTAAPQ